MVSPAVEQNLISLSRAWVNMTCRARSFVASHTPHIASRRLRTQPPFMGIVLTKPSTFANAGLFAGRGGRMT